MSKQFVWGFALFVVYFLFCGRLLNGNTKFVHACKQTTKNSLTFTPKSVHFSLVWIIFFIIFLLLSHLLSLALSFSLFALPIIHIFAEWILFADCRYFIHSCCTLCPLAHFTNWRCVFYMALQSLSISPPPVFKMKTYFHRNWHDTVQTWRENKNYCIFRAFVFLGGFQIKI